MGVKTNVAGISLTGGDITQAATLGIDAKALLLEIQLHCQEATQKMNVLITDVLTPASDSSNITTLNTAITALA